MTDKYRETLEDLLGPCEEEGHEQGCVVCDVADAAKALALRVAERVAYWDKSLGPETLSAIVDEEMKP